MGQDALTTALPSPRTNGPEFDPRVSAPVGSDVGRRLRDAPTRWPRPAGSRHAAAEGGGPSRIARQPRLEPSVPRRNLGGLTRTIRNMSHHGGAADRAHRLHRDLAMQTPDAGGGPLRGAP